MSLAPALSACSDSASRGIGPATGADRGPLVLPDGYTGVMAPSPKRAYITIDTCVAEADGDVEVTIEGVSTRGAWSDADLVWKVAWPTSGEPVVAGSAEGPAPPRFRQLPSSGVPDVCGGGDSSPVLAVEFPPATSAHLGFDAVEVRYSTGDQRFASVYDVSLGICAAGVPDPGGPCDLD